MARLLQVDYDKYRQKSCFLLDNIIEIYVENKEKWNLGIKTIEGSRHVVCRASNDGEGKEVIHEIYYELIAEIASSGDHEVIYLSDLISDCEQRITNKEQETMN